MAEVTVDTLLAGMKEALRQQEEISKLEDALIAQTTKLEQDGKLLLSSGNLSVEDRIKLVDGLTQFMMEALRAAARRSLARQQQTQAKTEAKALSGGGFPRFA